MLEPIVLGLIQGVVEWLPISSEGAIVATKNTFFSSGDGLSELIRLALFLHLGTFLAALIYFRREVFDLARKLKYWHEDDADRRVVIFLALATLVSGVVGITLLRVIVEFEDVLKTGSDFINILIALMLFITAFLQLSSPKDGLKFEVDLKVRDGLLLGLAQGLAVIPGLSRSGLTVSTLLLRKFNDTTALKLSFLLSLPIVFGGNIILNREMFSEFSSFHLLALLASFFAGLLTIDVLLRLARRINFGYFAIFFGVLVFVSIFF